MKRLGKSLFVASVWVALAASPMRVRAGVPIELSVGSGVQLSPKPEVRIPTNVMLASGYSFFQMLKLELGVVGNLGDVEGSKFNLSVRPMVVIAPPVFPLYLRAIFEVNGLVNGPTRIGYGGALGLSMGAFGFGGFLEAGYIPTNIGVSTSSGTKQEQANLLEGRLGVYWD